MKTSQLYKKLAAGLALGLLATSAMALELVAKPSQPSSKPDLTVLGVTRIDGQPMVITLPAPPQRGARIKVEADINKQVTESNETDNTNHFTY